PCGDRVALPRPRHRGPGRARARPRAQHGIPSHRPRCDGRGRALRPGPAGGGRASRVRARRIRATCRGGRASPAAGPRAARWGPRERREGGGLVLGRGAVIAGTVARADVPHAPVPGARVTLRPAVRDLALVPGREDGLSARTDAEGRYRLAGAPPGAATVVVA